MINSTMSLEVLAVSKVKTNAGYELKTLLDNGLIDPNTINTCLNVQWIKTDHSKEFEFNAGGYKFFAGWMEWLCLLFYETTLYDFLTWDESVLADRPFVPFLKHNKSDGSFDSATCKILYRDFTENYDIVVNQLGHRTDDNAKSALLQYEQFIEAFKFGADDGIVIFN